MAAVAHQPVLLSEAINALAVVPDGIYLDGTFGRGGHAAALLAQLGPQGRLLATDRDPDAIAALPPALAADPRFTLLYGPFSILPTAVAERGWQGEVSGLLLDLGVSSPQLDDAGRGFSFLRDGPLDMRMDSAQPITAASWLATVDEAELAHILRSYGEERFAGRIARVVCETRQRQPLTTTAQLAALVAAAVPRRERDRHPATRTFQALRIAVNRELEELDQLLADAAQMLTVGGRLAVISFHSLEDRRVKQAIRGPQPDASLPPDLPLTEAQRQRVTSPWRAIGKPIAPTVAECRENPRARSARLRVAERRV